MRVLPAARLRWLDPSVTENVPRGLGPNGADVLPGADAPIPIIVIGAAYGVYNSFKGQAEPSPTTLAPDEVGDPFGSILVGPGGPWNFVVERYFAIQTDVPAAHFHFEATVVHGHIENLQARVLYPTGQVSPDKSLDVGIAFTDLGLALQSPPGLGFSPIGNCILDSVLALPAGQYDLQIRGNVLGRPARRFAPPIPVGGAYQGYMTISTAP